MTITDILGYALVSILLAGFGWALIDLLVRIAKQRKRESNGDILPLLPYPFLPPRENENRPGLKRAGRLALQPVRVKNRSTGK